MGYGSFVWGFIFLFDINIGGFDILPDFVGYIFFLVGLKELRKLNGHYEKANTLSIILLVISLVFLFFSRVYLGGLEIVLGIVVTIITVYHIYSICMGIEEEAMKHDKIELAEVARKRWNLYLIMNLVVFLAAFMPHPIIFFPAFVFAIGVYVLMIGLMNQTNQVLRPELYASYDEY